MRQNDIGDALIELIKIAAIAIIGFIIITTLLNLIKH